MKITVKCIYCKAKKELSADKARGLSGPPLCEKEGGPMVVVKVSGKARI